MSCEVVKGRGDHRSLSLVVVGLPPTVDAQESAASDAVLPVPVDDVAAVEAVPTVEVVDERTETTKTFETDVSGVLVTEVYGEPVHFEDPATGDMVEIDPTVEVTSDGDFETVASPVTVEIAEASADESMVTVDLGEGMTASFGVEDTLSVPAEVSATGDVVAFDGLAEDASLVLEPTGSGVKETIILDSPDAPTIWRFPVDLAGLVASIDPEFGHVLLHAADDLGGEPVAMVPHGWMVDAAFGTNPDEAASYSEGVVYTLEDTAEGLVLVVSIDEVWLADPDRVWPVSVDPTITQVDASADDTWVTPYVGTDRSTLGYMYAGSLGWFVNNAYLHLDTTTVEDKVIHFAQFKALQTHGATCESTNVDLYRVTSAWAGLNLTWTNQPTVAGSPTTTTYTTHDADAGSGCSDAEWATWGVSDLVRNWADGTWVNHGISLRAPAGHGVNPDFWKKFSSANATWKPHLQVIWSESTATGTPDTPTDLQPSGVVADPYAPLSATFTDPQGDDGKVVFEVYDDTTNQLLAVGEGTTVASGQPSVFTPTSPADYDRPYRVEAHAIDEHDKWSLDRAVTHVTVSSVEVLSHQPGDTVFHTETVEADGVGAYGIDSVEFFADTTLIGTDTNGTDGWTIAWDTTGMDDGDVTLTATVNTTTGGYPSAPVGVVVDNSMGGPDRVQVDYDQDTIDLDTWALEMIRAIYDDPGRPVRYLAAPVVPGDFDPYADYKNQVLGVRWNDLGASTRGAIDAFLSVPPPEELEPPGLHPPCGAAASYQPQPLVSNRMQGPFCVLRFPAAGAAPPLEFLYLPPNGTESRVSSIDGGELGASADGRLDQLESLTAVIRAAFDTYSAGDRWDVPTSPGPGMRLRVAITAGGAGYTFEPEGGDASPTGAPDGIQDFVHGIEVGVDADAANVAHEVFHVVQYNYVNIARSNSADFRLSEGTAQWAPAYYSSLLGTALNDLVGEPVPGWQTTVPTSSCSGDPRPFYGRLGQANADFFEPWSRPWEGLNVVGCFFTEPQPEGYASSMFWQYLSDRYSGTTPSGPDIVRDIWEGIATESVAWDTPDLSHAWEVIETVTGDPIDEILADHAVAMHLLTSMNDDPRLDHLNWEHPSSDQAAWRARLEASGDTDVEADAFGPARTRRTTGEANPELSYTLDFGLATGLEFGNGPPGLQRGGSQVFDFDLSEPFVGEVTVIDDAPSTVAVTLVAYGPSGYPEVCIDGYGPRIARSGAPPLHEVSIRLDPSCPTFSILVTHAAPDGSSLAGTLDIDFEAGDLGGLDDTFGSPAGFATLNYPIVDLAVQADDKIVALLDGDDGDMVVARLNPNGSLDTTFGSDGYVTYPKPPGLGYENQVPGHVGVRELTPGEPEIVVASSLVGYGGGDIGLVVIDHTGSVSADDILDMSDSLYLEDLLVDSAGRPVVAARTAGTTPSMVLARWQATSAALDSGFDGDGVHTVVSAAGLFGVGGVVEAGGRYLALADVYNGVGVDNTVWAINPSDGGLDTTWGSAGTRVLDSGLYNPAPAEATDIVVSPGSSTVFVRYRQYLAENHNTAYVAWYGTGGGFLDETQTHSLHVVYPPEQVLAIDSIDRYYLTGPTDIDPFDFNVRRYNPTLDTTWDTNGFADTGDLPLLVTSGVTQTIGTTERLVVAGTAGNTPIIARYTEDGD